MDAVKMSPEPSLIKSSVCELSESVTNDRNIICSTNEENLNKTMDLKSINYAEQGTVRDASTSNATTTMASDTSNFLSKPPSVPVSVGREKRNIPSPSALLQLHDGFAEPQSPSSSSTTSQSTSANDATFEPTIEMMVNDFDDEQTLNEEEALAAQESQDPEEEINTLKEESEMPLEELLAKYRAYPPPSAVSFSEASSKKKSKKSSASSSHKKKHKIKHKHKMHSIVKENLKELSNSMDIIAKANLENCSENSREEKDVNAYAEKLEDYNEEVVSSELTPNQMSMPIHSTNEELKESDKNSTESGNGHGEILKVRRSHLLDLYPEGTFDNVVVIKEAVVVGNGKDILEKLYGVEDDDEDEEIEEEEDEEYKKKVMIGSSYQATIPVGLSQYGDILPYENEDKLIWEPSQVSEREVEEYLIKIRDIKANQQVEEDDASAETSEESQSKENGRGDNNNEDLENNSFIANKDKTQVQSVAALDIDSQAVIKDNEQALHLLVQCGYDFKEALRRKRLNALPLNDCMSLWSEEECHKFEEGIQKYGKDFLKIRQNQVRTRTMRELVQFYYLWKKSERRDQTFANADTVDHMDIYLNEDNEYGSNPASVLTPVDSPVGTNTSSTGARRNSNASQKTISIMTTNSLSAATPIISSKPVVSSTSEKNISTTSVQQQHKRRTHGNNHAISDYSTEVPAAILTNSSK